MAGRGVPSAAGRRRGSPVRESSRSWNGAITAEWRVSREPRARPDSAKRVGNSLEWPKNLTIGGLRVREWRREGGGAPNGKRLPPDRAAPGAVEKLGSEILCCRKNHVRSSRVDGRRAGRRKGGETLRRARARQWETGGPKLPAERNGMETPSAKQRGAGGRGGAEWPEGGGFRKGERALGKSPSD